MPSAANQFRRRRAIRLLAGWASFAIVCGAYFGFRAWLRADRVAFGRREIGKSVQAQRTASRLRHLLGQPVDVVGRGIDFPLAAAAAPDLGAEAGFTVRAGSDPVSGRAYRLNFNPSGTLAWARTSYDDPHWRWKGVAEACEKPIRPLALLAVVLWIIALLLALGVWSYHRRIANVLIGAAIVSILCGWVGWPPTRAPDAFLPDVEWYPPASWGLVMLAVSLIVLALPNVRRPASRIPRCRHCGYDLTGNESGRCPECGAVVAAVVYQGEAERLAGVVVDPPPDAPDARAGDFDAGDAGPDDAGTGLDGSAPPGEAFGT